MSIKNITQDKSAQAAVSGARDARGLPLFTRPVETIEEPVKEPAKVETTHPPKKQSDIEKWIAENIHDGGQLMDEEPPLVDPILQDIFDMGDLFTIIAPSKCRKSFCALQLGICIASGHPFIGIPVAGRRRVLLVQFEVKHAHYHRRLKLVSRGMAPDRYREEVPEIGKNLKIFSARGKGFSMELIQEVIVHENIEVVIFDPLYKMMDGAENGAEDMKPIMEAFDRLCHETGAAVGYVHHDAKGNPGMRSTRDRGSGSGVIGRAYDACFTLTEHEEDGHVVFETLLRSYAPRKPFTALWEYGAFHPSTRPPITKKNTSPTANPTTAQADEDFFPIVIEAIEEHGPLNSGALDQKLRELAGVTKEKATQVRLAAIRDKVILKKNDFEKGKVHFLPNEGKKSTGKKEGEKS
jgi:hypothetical protein